MVDFHFTRDVLTQGSSGIQILSFSTISLNAEIHKLHILYSKKRKKKKKQEEILWYFFTLFRSKMLIGFICIFFPSFFI